MRSQPQICHLFAWMFAALLLAPLPACAPGAGTAQRNGEEGVAAIGVSAQAIQSLAASDVKRVTITISGAGIATPIVQSLVLNPSTSQWTGRIGGIPAGTNRTFLAQAYDAVTGGTKIYEGQATGITITAGDTTLVTILLQQFTAPSPYVNTAPRISAISASPVEVGAGQTASLSVTASDVDPGDSLTYAWTATGGTFSNSAIANPVWTAPTSYGSYTISVTVSDRHAAQAGQTFTLSVVQTKGQVNIVATFNAWPVASQVTGTPFGQVDPSGTVNFDVSAVDPDNDTITYSWQDDCQGRFSGTSIKSPVWTAPSSRPQSGLCTVTVTLSDGRGGSTTGQLGINIGLPPVENAKPVIDTYFSTADTISAGNTVVLRVIAHDPEGKAITFQWNSDGGAFGAPTNTAVESDIVWTAPATPGSYTINAVVQDADGQQTTQSFPIQVVGG